jgi:hypothetical protein
MPKAGLGPEVDLWVTENGYATNLGRTEAQQDASLASTVAEVFRYSGTLGVTDYRWFNLRDNNSTGPDLFDAVGLLRDDYTEKPGFGTYRAAIELLGRDTAGAGVAGAGSVLPAAGKRRKCRKAKRRCARKKKRRA